MKDRVKINKEDLKNRKFHNLLYDFIVMMADRTRDQGFFRKNIEIRENHDSRTYGYLAALLKNYLD